MLGTLQTQYINESHNCKIIIKNDKRKNLDILIQKNTI